jgi:hypothetical protein
MAAGALRGPVPQHLLFLIRCQPRLAHCYAEFGYLGNDLAVVFNGHCLSSVEFAEMCLDHVPKTRSRSSAIRLGEFGCPLRVGIRHRSLNRQIRPPRFDERAVAIRGLLIDLGSGVLHECLAIKRASLDRLLEAVNMRRVLGRVLSTGPRRLVDDFAKPAQQGLLKQGSRRVVCHASLTRCSAGAAAAADLGACRRRAFGGQKRSSVSAIQGPELAPAVGVQHATAVPPREQHGYEPPARRGDVNRSVSPDAAARFAGPRDACQVVDRESFEFKTRLVYPSVPADKDQSCGRRSTTSLSLIEKRRSAQLLSRRLA